MSRPIKGTAEAKRTLYAVIDKMTATTEQVLKGYGWSESRIERAMQEVRTKLKEEVETLL